MSNLSNQLTKGDDLKSDFALVDMITDISNEAGVDPQMAINIAKCESGLRQFNNDGEVVRGKVNPADVGVFQINETFHLKSSRNRGYDIHTTEGNIGYAMYLIKRQGTVPWNYSKNCWVNKA